MRYIMFVLAMALMLPACASKKTGCPINEQATAGTDRKGNLMSKKGKSSLFGPNKSNKRCAKFKN